MRYEFDAVLYVWQARQAERWTFVDLPTDVADDVLERAAGVTRGFGSVRVEVTVGATTWRTSVFPGTTTFALPVKAAVRRAEGLDVGDTFRVALRLVDVEG